MGSTPLPVCPTQRISKHRVFMANAERGKTSIRGYGFEKNMQPLASSVSDAVFLKKRISIEPVIKEIKTQTQVEHSRHSSFINFQVNAISALSPCMYFLKKPTFKFGELQALKIYLSLLTAKTFFKLTLMLNLTELTLIVNKKSFFQILSLITLGAERVALRYTISSRVL